EASERPQLVTEFGLRLPGEPWSIKSNTYAQLSLQWDIPLKSSSFYAKEEILADIQLLNLTEEELRRSQHIKQLENLILDKQQIEQLKTLEKQREVRVRLEELSRRRFKNGTASSLELSAVEGGLLTNASETTQLQSSIYRQIVNYAEVQG